MYWVYLGVFGISVRTNLLFDIRVFTLYNRESVTRKRWLSTAFYGSVSVKYIPEYVINYWIDSFTYLITINVSNVILDYFKLRHWLYRHHYVSLLNSRQIPILRKSSLRSSEPSVELLDSRCDIQLHLKHFPMSQSAQTQRILTRSNFRDSSLANC